MTRTGSVKCVEQEQMLVGQLLTHLVVPKVASEGCSTSLEMVSARRAGMVPQDELLFCGWEKEMGLLYSRSLWV
jgi:hypothetical protein